MASYRIVPWRDDNLRVHYWPEIKIRFLWFSWWWPLNGLGYRTEDEARAVIRTHQTPVPEPIYIGINND